ncbi:MAG: hypothetical protein JWM74_5697 [Myxococcaceae bacterium]|nr:hypothetical protein [Myxococcaceae bacterium]
MNAPSLRPGETTLRRVEVFEVRDASDRLRLATIFEDEARTYAQRVRLGRVAPMHGEEDGRVKGVECTLESRWRVPVFFFTNVRRWELLAAFAGPGAASLLTTGGAS